MPSLLSLLAAVLLSPKRIYRTTDRCWDSEAGAESQGDWIRKQKRQKKKKKKSLTKTSHFTAHIAHASLHGERKGSLNPARQMSGVLFRALLEAAQALHRGGNTLQETMDNFTTKILAGTVWGRKMHVQSRRPWNLTFLVLRPLIIKHKVLVLLMLSHEGSLWIGGVPGFLFLHAHTLFQRLSGFHKATNLIFLYATPPHINIP